MCHFLSHKPSRSNNILLSSQELVYQNNTEHISLPDPFIAGRDIDKAVAADPSRHLTVALPV
jgi:hypothetical protein